jgi:hypothetical protein
MRVDVSTNGYEISDVLRRRSLQRLTRHEGERRCSKRRERSACSDFPSR